MTSLRFSCANTCLFGFSGWPSWSWTVLSWPLAWSLTTMLPTRCCTTFYWSSKMWLGTVGGFEDICWYGESIIQRNQSKKIEANHSWFHQAEGCFPHRREHISWHAQNIPKKPKTVTQFFRYYRLMFIIVLYIYISYLQRSWCWSRRYIGFQHCKEPWLQRTMAAKHNDCKAQWLQRTMACNDWKEEWPQRTMTAKKDDCKKTMTARKQWLTARKQWLQESNDCKQQCWKDDSHKLLCFHPLSCRFSQKSRKQASFAQLQLAGFDGSLARKLVFTSSACS